MDQDKLLKKQQALEVKATPAKKFVNNWLTNRKLLLKENVRTFDSFVTPNMINDYSNERINGILSNQISNVNVTSIIPTTGLGDNVKGDYNSNTKSIHINNRVVNSKDSIDIDNTLTHEITHALRAFPQEFAIKKLTETYLNKNSLDPYLDSSREIYSRLMIFRKQNGLKPEQIVTPTDLKEWRRKLNGADLSRYPDDFLLDLFNTIANNNTPQQQNYNPQLLQNYLSMMNGLYNKITS
jgi:hypothetical protein